MADFIAENIRNQQLKKRLEFATRGKSRQELAGGAKYSHITDACCDLDMPNLRADFFEGQASLLGAEVEFELGSLHLRRAKGGATSPHPLLGDELRALRVLKREAKSPFVFVSERGVRLGKTHPARWR